MVECLSCWQKTRVERVFSVRNLKGVGLNRYGYLRCEKCGALFISPFPSDGELEQIYAGYWQYTPHKIAFWAFLQLQLHIQVCKSRFRFASRLSPDPGRILDVGCGTGEFLKDMKQAGWDVWGNEVSEGTVEQARENVGEDRVYLGTLQDCRFPSRYFDMVTLWYVLEHLREPYLALMEVRRILKPEGILIVEIPNVKSLSLRLFGENWTIFSSNTPEHLFYWSKEALDTLLENSGFQLVESSCPVLNPCPLDFGRSFGNFLKNRWGAVVGLAGFLVSVPISVFNNFVGNFLFGTGEVVRFVVRRSKSDAENQHEE